MSMFDRMLSFCETGGLTVTGPHSIINHFSQWTKIPVDLLDRRGTSGLLIHLLTVPKQPLGPGYQSVKWDTSIELTENSALEYTVIRAIVYRLRQWGMTESLQLAEIGAKFWDAFQINQYHHAQYGQDKIAVMLVHYLNDAGLTLEHFESCIGCELGIDTDDYAAYLDRVRAIHMLSRDPAFMDALIPAALRLYDPSLGIYHLKWCMKQIIAGMKPVLELP